MSDPFDEFEFKPLTEGLGFHKKTEKPKTSGAKPAKADSRPAGASAMDHEIVSRPSVEIPSARSLLINDATENDLLGRDSAREPSRAPSQSIKDLIASLPPSLDFISSKEEESLQLETRPSLPSFEPTSKKSTSPESGRPQIFQPLAREEYKAPSVTPAAPTIGQVLPPPGTKAVSTGSTLGSSLGGAMSGSMTSPAIPAPTIPKPTAPSPFRERLDESFARAFPHAEKIADKKTEKILDRETETATGLEPVPAHLGAAFVDGMVVTGMATILLVCIVAITRVNLTGLLSNAQTDGPTQIHLALLFIAVMHLYLLTARSFFGASLGEWAFDMQLGTDADRARAIYPLQVAWRTIVVTITGFVLLPLLSLVFGRDLAKYVTGLQLFRRP